ncbi:MAG: restriction endonuclease subunit S [Alphaproteobacteria bacterium]|nr:restriction endonuclease subunit S [Alphaproteobacteria bacterium]
MLKLTDREWKEFKIADTLNESINAKAYHSNSLIVTSDKGIPYITRTNLSNGLQSIVDKNQDFKKNPQNTIVFGAENATYFYQPFKYITGNKMYYYNTSKLSQEVNLFITCCLNFSLKECGFGYGMGLTGTRSDSRKFLLPVNNEGQPDYKFMEDYIKEVMTRKRKEYINYAESKLMGG